MSANDDLIENISSRVDLTNIIDKIINESAISLTENQRFPENISKVKTYQIESNSHISEIEFSELVELHTLEDENLHKLVIKNANQTKPLNFFLDTSYDRFWSIYSFNKSRDSDGRIKHLVNHSFNHLDSFWFPVQFISQILELGDLREVSSSFRNEIHQGLEDEFSNEFSMRIWGSAGIEIYDLLSQSPKFINSRSLNGVEIRFLREYKNDIGDIQNYYVDERVQNDGKISVKGTSAALHFEFVNNIKQDYEKLIKKIEDNRLTINDEDMGLTLDGLSIALKFSKKIKNHQELVKDLIGGKNQLRIRGMHNKISSNHYIIPAVDLHNGDRLDIELLEDTLYVNLWDGACGNTILRLLTNLQMMLDSSTTMNQYGKEIISLI